MRPPTLACEAKGSLVIFVGTPSVPDDQEWDAYLGLVKSVGLKWQTVRIAIFADRDVSAPHALQRKRAAALNHLFVHHAVVISDSLVARTAVTALRWLGMNIRGFAPSQQEEALLHLQVSPEERTWLLETEHRLRAQLRDAQPPE